MKNFLLFVLFMLSLCSCTVRPVYTNRPHKSPKTIRQANTKKHFYAVCSFYGKKFHGRLTANGEKYDMYGLTAAHKSLPFNTKFKVTNEDNGKSIVIRINDRGPFVAGRDFDLSYGAAEKLGYVNEGVKKLKFELIK